MSFILAHEWSHILQFERKLTAPVAMPTELHADCLAGWQFGLWASQFPGSVNVSTAFRSVFEKGDYAFNEPDHQGTPAQRLAAATAGFQFSSVHGRSNLNDAFEYAIQIAQSVG